MEKEKWPRSTMDSIRVSEAPDPSSILGEATKKSTHSGAFAFCNQIFFIFLPQQNILSWQLLSTKHPISCFFRGD